MKLITGHIYKDFIEPKEEWLFFVPVILTSFVEMQSGESESWFEIFYYLLTAGISFAPVLLFKWFQASARNTWPGFIYRLVYGFLFLLYPLLLIWASVNLFAHLGLSRGFFAIAGVGMIAVEGLLRLHRVIRSTFQQRSHSMGPKIGFEPSILLILAIISIIIAFMAVSSLPSVQPGEELVIELRFSPPVVFDHLFVFISYAVQFFIYFLCWYTFYYLNHYVLYRGIFLNRGLLHYILALPAAIILTYPVVGQLILWLPLTGRMPDLLPSGDGNPFALLNGWIGLLVMAATFPLIIIRRWLHKNERISQLERQKAETELAMLKQQVNPHFFLNTLNNLYALSLNKSDQTPDMIMRLSELMRYVLYHGDKERVQLDDEISYMEDYLELQQMRVHRPLDLTFQKEITDPTLEIPPLMLIVLVENAFKHGIEPDDGPSFLSIELKTTDKHLHFTCENSIPQTDQQGTPGIGLENLERRLELQFPGRFDLQITHDRDSFKAELVIQLEIDES